MCFLIVAVSSIAVSDSIRCMFAFVTFLSSTATYTGPGTDGYVTRDAIMTTTLSTRLIFLVKERNDSRTLKKPIICNHEETVLKI